MMQHPDQAYAAVSSLHAARRARARVRDLLRAAWSAPADEVDDGAPDWLRRLHRCVDEPGTQAPVHVQGAAPLSLTEGAGAPAGAGAEA
jgi:hypothetical protein